MVSGAGVSLKTGKSYLIKYMEVHPLSTEEGNSADNIASISTIQICIL